MVRQPRGEGKILHRSHNIENSYPTVKKSVDELAAYLAYALQIVKNCDLPCEGVTTPGGFGNLVKPELSPPCIRLCATCTRPISPTISNSNRSSASFSRVVLALRRAHRNETLWMKVSEIARYWAAKDLTRIRKRAGRVTLNAPLRPPVSHFAWPNHLGKRQSFGINTAPPNSSRSKTYPSSTPTVGCGTATIRCCTSILPKVSPSSPQPDRTAAPRIQTATFLGTIPANLRHISMNYSRFLLAAALLLAPSTTKGAKPAQAAPVYTVAKYNAKRDPEKDLESTVARATKEKKRIMMIVGGNWCGWCRRLDRYFTEKPAVAAVLAKRYLIMKVNYDDDNANLSFLQDYPDISDFPHFYILDAKGKVVHSQSGSKMERFGSYKESAILGFLNKWAK
jgi:thioredoxin-related protein